MRHLVVAALLAPAVLLGWPGPPSAAAAPSTCAGLGGIVEAAHVCSVRVTNPTYMLNLTFPVDYPDQPALTDYITRTRDGFVNVAQNSGARGQPYQLETTAEEHSSGQPPRGTRSVVLKLFEDLGTRPSNWYKAFNYNLGTKRPITFEDLFAPGGSPLDAIFPIVQRDLERQSPFGATILRSTGMDPSHYQNFAITDDAVIFFFGRAELLPSYAGATSVSVPRTAIPALEI